VRKGLEGREAVAPSIKSMQSMGFYDWRDGTPAKPGFLLRHLPGFPSPEGGHRIFRSRIAHFGQVAEQKMRPYHSLRANNHFG
jgi:hypothetical protein